MTTKTSWERLYQALWDEQQKTKSKRLSFSSFYRCLLSTAGLAFSELFFSEGMTAWDLLITMEEMGMILVNKNYIKVLPKRGG